MSTETRESVDLAALFAEEVPCGNCGKSAQLRSTGHQPLDCNPGSAYYKCISCWQRWVQREVRKNAKSGRDYFVCIDCDQRFPTIESFSDYREF